MAIRQARQVLAQTNRHVGEYDTPLIDASRHARLADVLVLLSCGADVNESKTDGEGVTGLLVASRTGHVEIVWALLAADAAVDLADRCGCTALFWASRNGHGDVVPMLLAACATVDLGDDKGRRPLIAASKNGHIDVVSQLMAAGATVDLGDHKGRTPLFMASKHGQADVVTLLLAAGAAVDLADKDGDTPLIVASDHGHVDVVSQLLAAGAAVDLANRFGATPLILASDHGHADVVSQLLAAGAAANHVTGTGGTAMGAACFQGHLACVQLLTSFGATRTVAHTPEGLKSTAVQFKTMNHQETVAAWLVESRQWSTPLHHLRIVGAARAHELLRCGADLHAADAPGGPTPLSLAKALRAAGDPDAAEGSAASLVLAAAEPWGPRTHALFPAAARGFAVELLLLGHQLSRQPRFAGEEVSLVDVWTELVMPSAIVR